MEEGAVAVRALASLIIPLSVAAAVLGLILVVVSLRRISTGGEQPGSYLLESVAVVLCGTFSVVGAIGLLINEVRRNAIAHPAILIVLSVLMMIGAPALVWKSRWRVPAEGLATVAVAAATVLTGFSIGFAFVPLVALMILLCARHLALFLRPEKLAVNQVDSPP